MKTRRFSDIEILETICQSKLAKLKKLGPSLGRQLPSKRILPLVKPAILEARSPGDKTPFVIAEIKRASPTKGDIAAIDNPVSLASEYLKQGALAMSILCEEDYFKGRLEDLIAIKTAFPHSCILRKDFILTKEEISTSYLLGADMVLLIAAIFMHDLENLKSIYEEARRLGLTALIEIHNEQEWNLISSLDLNGAIIGINSRNLKDFKLNQCAALKLKAHLPPHIPVIFESGIEMPHECFIVGNSGFDGILCGSFLVSSIAMDSKNPKSSNSLVSLKDALAQGMATASKTSGFYEGLLTRLASRRALSPRRPLVKVCGINDLDFLREASAHADLLGFVLSDKSPRFVGEEFLAAAGGLLDSINDQGDFAIPPRIGVVTRDSLDLGLSMLRRGLLDALQLHGITKAVDSNGLYFPGYVALNLEDFLESKAKTLASYGVQMGGFVLWDSSHGSSKALNIQSVKQLEAYAWLSGNLWLAGGINLSNLDEVLALNPMLIDICSGFESSRGKKDAYLLEEFFSKLCKLCKA